MIVRLGFIAISVNLKLRNMDLTKAKLEYDEDDYFGYILDDGGIFADFYSRYGEKKINCFKKYVDCEYVDVISSAEQVKAMFDLLDATPARESEKESFVDEVEDLYFINGVKPENFY
jgi:hypothetical protein